MSNLVQFPGLGISINVSRVAFTIFGIDIYWYGLLIGIGMVLALVFAFKKAKSFGVDADRMVDVIIIGFVGAIIGARLYYILFVDFRYRTFFDIINLRDGGLAIYGGVIGAAIGAVIGCKWRKVPIGPMMDLTAMGFLVGQALGRWGNFFNQEAFGSNTTSLFGMISPATTAYLQQRESWLIEQGMFVDPNLPVHPTFLYESLWCAAGFFLLWWYSSRRRFNGEIALFYVMWYGVGRFFIEGLRTDSLYVFGIKVSQWLALISAVAALVAWLYTRKKTAGQPLRVPEIPPRTVNVRLHTDDGVVTVPVSWPASDKAPDKEQLQQIAKEVLKAEKELEKLEEDKAATEEPDEQDEQDGEENEAAEKPQKKTAGKGDPVKAPKKTAAKQSDSDTNSDEDASAAGDDGEDGDTGA